MIIMTIMTIMLIPACPLRLRQRWRRRRRRIPPRVHAMVPLSHSLDIDTRRNTLRHSLLGHWSAAHSVCTVLCCAVLCVYKVTLSFGEECMYPFFLSSRKLAGFSFPFFSFFLVPSFFLSFFFLLGLVVCLFGLILVLLSLSPVFSSTL